MEPDTQATEPKKMGRPNKYNNQETFANLEQIVYLYTKENESDTKIKISDVVRFSGRLHKEAPDRFPLYNRDVWVEYGRPYIDRARKKIQISIDGDSDSLASVLIPNVVEIVEAHANNPEMITKLLKPLEYNLHQALRTIESLKLKNNQLEEELASAKVKNREQKEQIDSWERYALEMAHVSYHKEFAQKYGLHNQLSISANPQQLVSVGNLSTLFNEALPEEPQPEINAENKKVTSLSKRWDELRKGKNKN